MTFNWHDIWTGFLLLFAKRAGVKEGETNIKEQETKIENKIDSGVKDNDIKLRTDLTNNPDATLDSLRRGTF
jgi:hypothetical protein